MLGIFLRPHTRLERNLGFEKNLASESTFLNTMVELHIKYIPSLHQYKLGKFIVLNHSLNL